MISKIDSGDELEKLCSKDVCAGKIKCFFRSYGLSYDFCTFYKQNCGLIISKLDGDYVIAKLSDDYDAEELAAFLAGARAMLLPSEIMRKLEKLSPYKDGDCRYNNLMLFSGDGERADCDENPRLDEAYKILKNAFGIPFDGWYTDTSHRVRHGISRVFMLGGVSTATAFYDDDDTVLITQVGTLDTERGKGYARRLMRHVAGKYTAEGKSVYLICRDSTRPFYEKCGFIRAGEISQYYAK